MTREKLKTRFAPSPTGYLHVGGARTALFSWIMARKTGGTFVLRIEDTDRARHEESAVGKIADDLRWLGIEWDEGVGVGGPDAPYRQSERLDLYRSYVDRLLAEGKAYHAFDTSDELDALRRAATDAGRTYRYERPDTFPDAGDVGRARAEGRPVVVRFAAPARDVTIRDDAFGEVTMPAGEMDDFIILKADGYPTYHLANVVDDGEMGVNYVMRGQEFLGQTWRHVLLREALGFPEPGYCHLPLIMDMEGRKLSKRDGAVEVHAFRRQGYLPEALRSFLALLGWAPGTGQELFTPEELIELFDPSRIGKANAKFDRDKLLAFNTDAAAAADEDRLVAGLRDFLALNDTPIPADDDALLRRLVRINRGFRTFRDVVDKCGVLFGPDDAYPFEPKAVKKGLRKGTVPDSLRSHGTDDPGAAVLADIRPRLERVEWTGEAIEAMIREYCEEKELGMGKVAQPIRVAVTGKLISPPITDTLELLGRARTLARIDRCLREAAGS